MTQARHDDFAQRRLALAGLPEAELEARFWRLAGELVAPMVELARTHTSPSIERSVLLRMGFSGDEARAIASGCVDHGLLGKGAGHVVWRLAQARGASIREAGLLLAAGRAWDQAAALFGGGRP